MRRSQTPEQQTGGPPVPRPTLLPPARALALPFAFTLLLFALSLLPTVRQTSHLLWSFWGAGAALLVWIAGMFLAARSRGRTFALDIALRKQHYLQACSHISILLYWGWYWREVYHAAPLIAGQLAFAFAFDALLSWTRRDAYTLGFGPLPIVFSTNLFLWFKPEWFYLQFLMVAVGFSAKELIRWNKDGRQTHIFNPSSFTLMLFSIVLLLTGKTGITWGPEIATTQLNPPHIYLLIFLVTLPAQFLFGVAPMTWAAVTTAYLVEVGYFAATGIHFFPERPVPIAVFLGAHLLFTDPSTSPRTELGRLTFGVLYGLAVVGLLAFLTYLKLPTFYDKLLPVPMLNVLIQGIDRAARSNMFKRFDPAAIGRGLMPRRRNLAYMAIWALTFITIQVVTGTQATLVRADSLLSQGRIDEAIARYREFVATDPDAAEGHNNLGVALMQAGRVDEAIASFQRSIALRPDAPKTLDNLGLALMRQGQFANAVPPLQEAIRRQPDNPETHEHLGQALMQSGRIDEGFASLQRAITLQPDRAEAHHDFGVALMQAGRFPDAVASLRRADELQPGSMETLNNLGVALMRAGRVAEAVAPLQHAVDLAPDSSEARDNFGQALMQSGRFEDAVAAFERAVALQPDSPAALNSLGVALMQAGRFEPAVAALRKVVALRPDSPQSHDNLGVALMRTQRVDEALVSFHRAVLVGPNDPDAHGTLGQALLQAGRVKDAVASFQRAVDLTPDSPQALATLAWVEATERDAPLNPQHAVGLASRAAELSGKRDAHILDVLAAAYAVDGRLADAVRTAEAAEALAAAGPDTDLLAQIRARLSIYRTRHGTR
jgi:tetratricopeptide (TPR) repeat protein